MVIIVKPNTEKKDIDSLVAKIKAMGVSIQPMQGENTTILGLIGDTSKIDIDNLLSENIIERITRVQEPFKKANRKFHPLDTVINVRGHQIGGSKLSIMAGPCSVESEEQIVAIAKQVKESGASFLRGGAYKPRTSPYAFQGMGEEGLKLLSTASKETGLPIVTELMNANNLDLFEKYDVAVIQIGARNMQNFDLLKEVGKTKRPVLLKRGLSSTLEELLMSAEYIMASGNENVILCERGIRTYESYTRNTLDISAVPALKKMSHLPVIIDPSHAAGISWMVEPLAKAAVAAGADGIMVEVHNNPTKALCDGAQSITPEEFDTIVTKLRVIAAIENRSI